MNICQNVQTLWTDSENLLYPNVLDVMRVTFYVIAVIYDVFLVFSSILLGKAIHPFFLILLGCSLVLFWTMERRWPGIRILQVPLLVLFQLSSQLNWSEALYFLVSIKYLYHTRRFYRSIALTIFLATLFEWVRFQYSSPTLYALLGISADLFGALMLIIVFNFIVNLEEKQKSLQIENRILMNYDILTNLLNYEGLHLRLEQLIAMKQPFTAFLVDCSNMKSMNHEYGFQKGNEVLQDVADCLTHHFDDALMIARYNGDKFAVVLKTAGLVEEIERFTDFVGGHLIKILEKRCSFSFSSFPGEGQSKDEILAILEEQLFDAKKAAWLTLKTQLHRNDKMKVLGEIAASMAHEIRNPLTTVKGFLQMSRSQAYNVEPWYDLMMGEVQRINALTEEFLLFSRPHVTHFDPHLLQHCVTKAATLVQSEAISLGHSFIAISCEPDLLVCMDVEKIIQVLINLLKNAFEAMTPAGTVTLRLYQDNDEGVIEIQDTGPGVPEEALEQIFYPFYTTKETGTGLGLYICHQIISEHSGTIAVVNLPTGGACFRLSFPLLITAI